MKMIESFDKKLIKALYYEADLCRNKGVIELAKLLEKAAIRIEYFVELESDLRGELMAMAMELTPTNFRFLQEKNGNKVEGYNSYLDIFGNGKNFSIICNKCGSIDIQIIGEQGTDYGEEAGITGGRTDVKCRRCGNAATGYE